MKNYKALKSASKVSVRNQKVVTTAADKDKGIEERSYQELQVVSKNYDPNTGEAKDDSVGTYSLLQVETEIGYCKSKIAKLEAQKADWEELEKDLKAL